jgi:hypothetical protein
MAESLNTQLADAFTARQIQAGRVETDARRQLWAALTLLEADLVAALKAGDPTEFVLLARRRREVERLIEEELGPLITSRYGLMAAHVSDLLRDLARLEARATRRIVADVTAADPLDIAVPPATLRRRIDEALIPTPTRPTDLSTRGDDWWQRQGASLQQRLGDQLLVSVSLGESLTQATARVRGTPELGFQDGMITKAKQDAARLLRTQVTNAVSEARVAVGEANAGAGMVLVHVSTIDSRTSIVCLGRHGLRYTASPDHDPIGHDIPYLGGPPYHPNCRSVMTMISATGGAIPEPSVTGWLRRRDTAFQDEVLGPTRARLWRAGQLSPRDLIEAATGRPLTLEELGT